MGSFPPSTVNLELTVNMISPDIKNFSANTATFKNYPFKFEAKAKGKNGKEIPVIMKISRQNFEENIFSKPAEIKEKNKNDNNIKDNNDLKSFSIFNNQNLKDIKDINNENNEKQNHEEKNEINNNKNNQNDKINIQKGKNNFLKEGIYTQTKFGDDNYNEENNNNIHTAIGENINLDCPKNPYEEESKIRTKESENKSNNMGYAFKNEEKKDNYLDNNYSKNDLEMSQSIELKDVLGESWKMIQKGYAVILMKLDDLKILPFFIKEENTLKSLIKTYYQYCPETPKGYENDIKLYNEKRLLDINIPIKDLKLVYPSIVTNKIIVNNNNDG